MLLCTLPTRRSISSKLMSYSSLQMKILEVKVRYASYKPRQQSTSTYTSHKPRQQSTSTYTSHKPRQQSTSTYASYKHRQQSTSTLKVLFCGEHMKSGYEYTRELLRNEKDVLIKTCHRDDVVAEIQDSTIIIPLMSKISRELLMKAKTCKLINQYGVGLEGVDIQAATDLNIPVANIQSGLSGNAQSCAEHSIFLALSLLRDTFAMKESLYAGGLGTPTGRTLYGASALIYGYGDLGRYLSSRLKAFEMRRVVAIGRRKLPVEDGIGSIHEYGTILDDFPRLAKDVDIIFLCCSQSVENIGMVDKTFLQYLKPGCLLINVARGGLLNYKDVEEALISGHLGGLGMDVYHTEPFTMNDPIFKLRNVIATPHVAGVTEISYRTQAQILCDNILRIKHGVTPTGVVNMK